METFCEFGVVVSVDFKGGEVDANRCGIADGGGAAYLQFTNCCPDFALRFEVEVFGFVREAGLVDDDEGALLFVKGEGFHVEDVGGHCVPLFVKYIMAPLPPRFAWSPSPVATGEAKIGDEMKSCDSAAASGRPADLSKKQAQRAQLIGKQVVCENDPRTRAMATCDWLSLTASPSYGGGWEE